MNLTILYNSAYHYSEEPEIPSCPSCGTEYPPGASLCASCGFSLQPPQPAPTTPSATKSLKTAFHARRNRPWIVIGVVATLVLASIFAAGVLNSSPPEKLSVQGGFNDQDQPAFIVNNTGSVDVSITQILVHTDGSNLVVYATQLSWNLVPAGSAVLIVATFQGINFQPRTLYNFTLITAKGDRFPASASYGTYTFVQQLNIVGATINISTGAVAFNLANSGTSDVIISSASVTGGSFNNTPGTISASGTNACTVTNGQATVPKGTTCSMTATFGTGFAAGTTYTFILDSTQGHRFPYTTTA